MPVLLAAGSAAITALVIRRARPFRVEVAGMSMGPMLLPGDYLVATKGEAVRVGALVVVDRPDQPGFELVKRVAGIPGDRIGDRVLRSNEYWVLGDKPDRSTDSRTFGPVMRANIKGVVRLRYWPLSRFRWLSDR